MVVLVNPTKLTAGVLRPCKFLLLFPLTGFLQLSFVAESYARLLSLANGQTRLRRWRAWELWSIKEPRELQVKTASSSLFFIPLLVDLLFYIDHTVLEKYHVVITTYDTVKSEYDSYNLSAKDESKKSKASSKRKDTDSDFDDSESDSFSKTKKSKGAKKCALFNVKWWRSVLGAIF